ncbi:zinc finger protein 62 homolog [Spodoptera frugiperda]|uniref:Zinc finger protein 62 homolog n=1 Tax=Spodoptera frugiperda TaxID=7108 RepID=A0A9R0DKA5_SPOFR|nr:zinc finger protein 62 homolog [Spodoptera frugiperda]
MKCFIQSCVNTDKINKINESTASNPNRITFHSFPKDPKQRAAWLESLSIPSFMVTPKHVICSEHFNEDDFYITKHGTRRIKYGVVPEINYDLQQPANRVCKLCLRIDAKMFDLNEETLNKMYLYVIGIEPRTDSKDRFPMNICWECKARLHAAAAFKCKALTSDQLMQEHLESHEELNITEISNLHQEHNLKSSLVIEQIDTLTYETETHKNTESDTLVKTETIGFTFEEELDENSQINEIVIKNENKVSEDETKTEIEIIPNNSQDSFQCDAPKVNWDNILLVKTPTVADNQFNITVFDNDSKMADMNDTNDDCFDTNTDDGAEKIVDKNTVKRKTRKMDTSKNRWIEPQKKPYVKPTIPIDETVFTVKSLSQERLIEEVMARKNSARYLRAPYKCTVCYKGFPSEDKLERHSMKHSEKAGPLKCVICKVRMKLGRQMRAHMKKQHTSEFICKLCPLVTRNRHVALGHMKFHAGSKYMCPQCGVQFEKQTTLLNHLRLKHMSDCVCELCGYTFVGDNGVRAHKRLRHKFDDKNQPLKGPHCEVCDIKFLNRKAYSKHLRLSSKHLKSEDDPNRLSNDPSIKTRRLDKSTVPVRRTRIHRREDIDMPLINGTVTCEQCGVECGGVRAYSRHFRRAHPGLLPAQCNTQVTPYMCEHCGKMFMNTTTLEGHMWVHTGQKRFQCDHCHKTFSMKSNLAGHMKQHEPVRASFACQLCGKLFAFNHNLTRHLRVHTGERPFKCDACEKTFRTSGELKAHVDHVHLKIPRPKRNRRKARKCDIPTLEY